MQIIPMRTLLLKMVVSRKPAISPTVILDDIYINEYKVV